MLRAFYIYVLSCTSWYTVYLISLYFAGGWFMSYYLNLDMN